MFDIPPWPSRLPVPDVGFGGRLSFIPRQVGLQTSVWKLLGEIKIRWSLPGPTNLADMMEKYWVNLPSASKVSEMIFQSKQITTVFTEGPVVPGQVRSRGRFHLELFFPVLCHNFILPPAILSHCSAKVSLSQLLLLEVHRSKTPVWIVRYTRGCLGNTWTNSEQLHKAEANNFQRLIFSDTSRQRA